MGDTMYNTSRDLLFQFRGLLENSPSNYISDEHDGVAQVHIRTTYL